MRLGIRNFALLAAGITIGAALSVGLTVEDVQAWPDILQAVTAEDIKAVAEKVLDRRQSVTGWVVSSQEEAS